MLFEEVRSKIRGVGGYEAIEAQLMFLSYKEKFFFLKLIKLKIWNFTLVQIESEYPFILAYLSMFYGAIYIA